MLSYIFAILVGVIVLGIDQAAKMYVATTFTLGETYEFIPGFIDLTYIHNKGGAWGMLSGYTWLLLSITVIVMLVCIAMLLKYGFRDKLMFWAVMLVLGGGIGNMIDRIFRDGNVIDFLHFEFMPDFPVFNIADCSIVIGAGLLILYFVLGMIKDAKNRRRPVADGKVDIAAMAQNATADEQTTDNAETDE